MINVPEHGLPIQISQRFSGKPFGLETGRDDAETLW